MARTQKRKARPGEMVILTQVPPGLLDDLPMEDQRAISAIVGIPIVLNEYDEDRRAELEFKESDGTGHFIYVKPDFIRLAERPDKGNKKRSPHKR